MKNSTLQVIFLQVDIQLISCLKYNADIQGLYQYKDNLIYSDSHSDRYLYFHSPIHTCTHTRQTQNPKTFKELVMGSGEAVTFGAMPSPDPMPTHQLCKQILFLLEQFEICWGQKLIEDESLNKQIKKPCPDCTMIYRLHYVAVKGIQQREPCLPEQQIQLQ